MARNKGFNVGEIAYFIAYLASLLFFFFSWANISQNKDVATFYVGMAGVGLILFIYASRFLKEETAREFYLTSPWSDRVMSYQRQILLAMVATGVLVFQLFTSNSAFISTPNFATAETGGLGVLTNALTNGLVFFGENLMIIALPSIYLGSILQRRFKNVLISVILTALFVGLFFSFFHQRFTETEQFVGAFVFGAFGSATTLLTRSTLTLDIVHFVNNVLVTVLAVVVFGVLV